MGRWAQHLTPVGQLPYSGEVDFYAAFLWCSFSLAACVLLENMGFGRLWRVYMVLHVLTRLWKSLAAVVSKWGKRVTRNFETQKLRSGEMRRVSSTQECLFTEDLTDSHGYQEVPDTSERQPSEISTPGPSMGGSGGGVFLSRGQRGSCVYCSQKAWLGSLWDLLLFLLLLCFQ